MKTQRHTKRLVGALAAVALVAGACGSDDDAGNGDDVATTDPGTEDGDETATAECETAVDQDASVASLAELDFSGIDVNVGSKDFVEQFVLGQLAIVGLEAGGANVTDSTNLGGTVVNRDALLANEIDTYFEYNGTGWTVHLGRDDPSFDSAELTTEVCVNDLEENDIRWVGVSPFNNTYGFATAGDSPAAGLDLQGMMEYVNENPDATVCMETEYPNRPDGLVLVEEATGLTIPAGQEQILDVGVIYDETATGNCTFGEVFTTDGRIPALGLELVEDPGVHILYNVSMTMPDSVYQQAPEAFQALADTILSGLDNDTVAELQRKVSADGEDPRDVAEEYLTEQGLI
jgi:osmoprotectant transport system substrate-binding protein